MIANHDVVDLCGMELANLSSFQLEEHIFSELSQNRGGWVVTANLDFLRRYTLDSQARRLYQEADIRVADGMPLVWAAKLQNTPICERVAGSSFVWNLAQRAAKDERSIYLLGGDDGAAEACRDTLLKQWPQLNICGLSNPRVSAYPSEQECEKILEELLAAKPDIVLVALGSPKQEWLIRGLKKGLPASWFMGVGITFSFVGGMVDRAPEWMQKYGLEWVHRMVHDPKRLAKRYLVDDLPFAFTLFAHSLRSRLRSTKPD